MQRCKGCHSLPIVVVVLFGLGHSSARATTIPLGAFQDASLLGGSDANTNQSLADPGIFVGTDGQGNPKRGLIEFNIAGSVPAGATITGATLTMTIGQVAGSGGGSGGGSASGETISLYNESQAWGQPTNVAHASSFGGTGHGGTPASSDATWNYAFYSSKAWTTAGGDWTSSLTAVAVNNNVTGTLTSFTWSSAAMVTDIQNWLDDPASNDGWIIKNSDEITATDFRAFWSAQGAAAAHNSFAPSLSVTYVVPEPVSVSLITFVAPILLCRRPSRRGK